MLSEDTITLTRDEASEVLGWLGATDSEGYGYDTDLARRLADFAGDDYTRERFGSAA
jgi:hypothetical protein